MLLSNQVNLYCVNYFHSFIHRNKEFKFLKLYLDMNWAISREGWEVVLFIVLTINLKSNFNCSSYQDLYIAKIGEVLFNQGVKESDIWMLTAQTLSNSMIKPHLLWQAINGACSKLWGRCFPESRHCYRNQLIKPNVTLESTPLPHHFHLGFWLGTPT